MPVYRDLAECDYFGSGGGKLIAIGWLGPEWDYPHGSLAPGFFATLLRLLVDPWQPAISTGRQACFLCRFTGGPTSLRYSDLTINVGSANLFIPAVTCVFVAPSMIAHYIDAHSYAPPTEFQHAVLNCPSMGSVAYLKEMQKHGVARLGTRPVSTA